MTKHSHAYESLQAQLEERQSELKGGLEIETQEAEKALLQTGKILGAIIASLGVVYLIYRLFSSKKELKSPPKKSRKSIIREAVNVKFRRYSDKLVEKILDTGFKILTKYLDQQFSQAEKNKQ
jgi:hypothetical protein